MKLELAVVSDTHWRGANFDLDRLVHRLVGAQYILHAGDAIAPEILERLQEVAPLLAVAGNCCQQALRQTLPLERQENLQGLELGMLHGHTVSLDDPDEILARFSDSTKLVIHGHTHLPRLQEHRERWIFNPGSVSEPRWGSPASYGWVTWESGHLHFEHRRF